MQDRLKAWKRAVLVHGRGHQSGPAHTLAPCALQLADAHLRSHWRTGTRHQQPDLSAQIDRRTDSSPSLPAQSPPHLTHPPARLAHFSLTHCLSLSLAHWLTAPVTHCLLLAGSTAPASSGRSLDAPTRPLCCPSPPRALLARAKAPAPRLAGRGFRPRRRGLGVITTHGGRTPGPTARALVLRIGCRTKARQRRG